MISVPDRFEFVSALAEGGVSTTTLARDAESGELVVVKVLKDSLATDTVLLARLEREAAVLRSIDCAGVPRLVDEGPAYLVIQYAGTPLMTEAAARLDRPYSADSVRAILAAVADALASVHLVGIVHRDVKPANITVDEHGAHLIDFGVAVTPAGEPLTHVGRAMGTPEYMAPELFKGAPASPSSDIYALGITAFELLTGHPPFTKGGAFGIAESHIGDAVPPLAGTPDDLAHLVHIMLSKDPLVRPTALHVGAWARGVMRSMPRSARGVDTLDHDGQKRPSKEEH